MQRKEGAATSNGIRSLVELALLVGALGYSFWPKADRVPPTARQTNTNEPEAVHHNASATPLVSTTAHRTPSDNSPTPGTAQPASSANPIRTTKTFTCAGRLVDSTGRPLDGVGIRLDRSSRRRPRNAAESVLASMTTAADGRFQIEADWPTALRCWLHAEAPARPPLLASLGKVRPGDTIDFGDVVAPEGVALTGQLVDTAGHPRSITERHVSITFRNGTRGPRQLAPAPMVQTRVQPDGTFAARLPVHPGRWKVSSPLLDFASTEPVVLAAPSTNLELVLAPPPPAHQTTIRGHVVDAAGKGVEGARVEIVDPSRRPQRRIESDASGSFVLTARSAIQTQTPVRLAVQLKSLEVVRFATEFAWGTQDVMLRVRRGRTLHLHVVRARDGTSVEQYTVKLRPLKFRDSFHPSFDRVRGGQNHPDGRVTLASLAPGEHELRIEVDNGLDVASVTTSVEIEDASTTSALVKLPRRVAQVFELRSAAGTPVAGSKLELIEPGRGPLLLNDHVRGADRGHSTSSNGWLVTRGSTDQRGRVTLSGPAGTTLAVRCRGHHAPFVRNRVQLSDQPIVIQVAQPAQLTVRGHPLSIIDRWRTLAGSQQNADRRRRAPSLHLRRSHEAGPSTRLPRSARDDARFEDTGRATLTDIPPGNYRLILTYPSAGGASREAILARKLRIAGGESRELDADLSAYRTGTVHGTVRLDGEVAPGSLSLEREAPAAIAGASPTTDSIPVDVASNGTFRAELPHGRWQAHFDTVVDGMRRSVPIATPIQVEAGQAQSCELEAGLVTNGFQLLLPSGQPAVGLQLSFERGSRIVPYRSTTDAEGRVRFRGVAGEYAATAPIRSLSREARFMEHIRTRAEKIRADPRAKDPKFFHPALQELHDSVMVDLGQVVLDNEFAATTRVLRLTATWNR